MRSKMKDWGGKPHVVAVEDDLARLLLRYALECHH